MDFFGGVRSNFLDVHAAFAGCHQHGALGAAVDHQADIKFFLDISAFLNQQPAHLLAFGAGLVSLQLHAEDGRRAGFDVGG